MIFVLIRMSGDGRSEQRFISMCLHLRKKKAVMMLCLMYGKAMRVPKYFMRKWVWLWKKYKWKWFYKSPWRKSTFSGIFAWWPDRFWIYFRISDLILFGNYLLVLGWIKWNKLYRGSWKSMRSSLHHIKGNGFVI